MLLEKLNETIFRLKRNNNKGFFEFRATEHDGCISNIAFAIINEKNPAQNSRIEMTKTEFEMVCDALVKLRDLIDSPESLKSSMLNVSKKTITLEEDPIPLSLDGCAPKISEEKAMAKSLDEIDLGLASLDALEEEIINTHSSGSGTVATIPQPKLIAPTIPPSATATSDIISPPAVPSGNDGDPSNENEGKLDPREWDPW